MEVNIMEDEAEIRRQILQLEFQYKKDKVEMQKKHDETMDRIDATLADIARRQDRTQKHLDHITKLAGITFEELEFQDLKMQDAGEILRRQK